MTGNIRLAAKNDIPKIKALCDANISQDFYSEADFYQMIEDADKYLYIYDNPIEEGCAYFYFTIERFADALDTLNIPYDSKTAGLFADDVKTGILKSASTDKALRGKGVFTELLHFAITELEKMGMELLVGNAAISPEGKIYTGKMLLDEGFLEVERLKKPWSHIKSLCPVCKKEYCECDSAVFIKELK